MKLGIDCDGVMYDFAGAFMRWLLKVGWFEERGLEFPGIHFQPSKWEFYSDWGMSTAEFVDLCDQGVDAGLIFAEGDPYHGCKETIDYLSGEGHSINIITHRMFGKRSTHNTVDWLKRYEIGFDTITFAKDKTIVDVDLLLDDYEGNWKAALADDTPCVIMDHPWNQHLPADRVYSWSQFADYIDVQGASITPEFRRFFSVDL